MGKHLLLLLLGLSILLDFLQVAPSISGSLSTSLECHNCSYVNPDGSCQTERNTCKARKYQKCILRKYYEDGKVQYGLQFCGYLCGFEALYEGSWRMESSCCNDKDLCNNFFNLDPLS